MATNYIPKDMNTVTPYLMTKGVQEVIDFLKKVFEVREYDLYKDPEGRIAHATLLVEGSSVMLAEATDAWSAMLTMLYVYVKDVDENYRRAMEAGARSLREPTDELYGDRSCGVLDPSGNQWWIGTHKEQVSPEEMKRREEERAAAQV